MAVTAVANLAVKVADLEEAIAFYRRAGAEVTAPDEWYGGRRADVHLGPLHITLFTRAVYEDDVALPEEGFLHVALFSDDVDREIEGHDVVWGPGVVSGTFGTRRIVFVDAPGGMRLEFMEQLVEPATTPDDREP
jgi:catechol 2,3-dioxygenase-like lactoylglutathione lyase family enzyme